MAAATLGALALLVAGCASYGKVENAPRQVSDDTPGYSIQTFRNRWRNDRHALVLAFSGGGTRAAALSYGVLKELRDTRLPGSVSNERLLDAVQSISSVSGGSFTAAYFGLHGDRIFEDYEDVFLRQDVQGALLRRLLNPFSWFSSTGRTEMAVDYYSDTVFKGATFADMLGRDGPMIIVNASDLAWGVRFAFLQEYFDLLCSDLSSFPVARAVAASSAVPVLFDPVVLENHSGCGTVGQAWLAEVRETVEQKPGLMLTVDGLASYFDRDRRRYIQLVDGGISDNLGLRAFYEFVEIGGGIKRLAERSQRMPPRRLVLISVNAATDPLLKMNQSTRQPSIAESINAMSSVQLRRHSADTIALMQHSVERWATELSTPEQPVEPYFILLDFHGIPQPDRRQFLNQTPTSFSLTDEQVDGLIAAGGELLRNHPEFRRLMLDVAADARRLR